MFNRPVQQYRPRILGRVTTPAAAAAGGRTANNINGNVNPNSTEPIMMIELDDEPEPEHMEIVEIENGADTLTIVEVEELHQTLEPIPSLSKPLQPETVFIQLDDQQMIDMKNPDSIIITLDQDYNEAPITLLDKVAEKSTKMTTQEEFNLKEDITLVDDSKSNNNVNVEEFKIPLVIQTLLDELVGRVVEQVRQEEEREESSNKEVVYNDFEPIVWERGIGRLPGTELAFHISSRGWLELFCPVLPVREKMDAVVDKLGIKTKRKNVSGSLRDAAKGDKVRSRSSEGSLKSDEESYGRFGRKLVKAEDVKKPLEEEMRSANFKSKPKSNGKLSDHKNTENPNVEAKSKSVSLSKESNTPLKKQTQSKPKPTPIQIQASIKKAENPKDDVETTFCGHCSLLGVVNEFVDGRYCSKICQRTAKMIADEEEKSKHNHEKVKKGRNSKNGDPAVVYARKTSVSLLCSEQGSSKSEVHLRIEEPEVASKIAQIESGNPDPPKNPGPPKMKTESEMPGKKRPVSSGTKKRDPQKPLSATLTAKPAPTKATPEFTWSDHLSKTHQKSAPLRLFRQPCLPSINPFKEGMMLEAIDPQHASLFCVVQVVKTLGHRLVLNFTGYPDSYDFYVNADSYDIFPPGWCEENGQTLQPPFGCKDFNWHTYIVESDAKTACRDYFSVSKEDFRESEVKLGMKLEAVDLRNLNYICVATVKNVINDRILIHFDSWDDVFDYWTDLTSPFVHPVGWCSQNESELVPPYYGDERDVKFDWAEYLKLTKSVPLPTKLFRPLPPVNFKKGMKLECVDKRNPALIRVASIEQVEKHFVTIHFDGWDNKYDYRVYELNPDLHPVGYCAKTGHRLEGPPDTGSNEGCHVFGCNGIGHLKGTRFSHDSEKNCPYSDGNCGKEWVLADRLIFGKQRNEKSGKAGSRRSSLCKKQEASPVLPSEEIKPEVVATPAKMMVKRQSKRGKNLEEVEHEPEPKRRLSEAGTKKKTKIEEPVQSPEITINVSESEIPIPEEMTSPVPITRGRGRPKKIRSSDPIIEPTKKIKAEPIPDPITTNATAPPVPSPAPIIKTSPTITIQPLSNTDSSSEELPFNFPIHIQTLTKLVQDLNPDSVADWDIDAVAEFIVKLGCSTGIIQQFKEQRIDGESFLLLTQKDITGLGFPLGPAMKIAHALRLIHLNGV